MLDDRPQADRILVAQLTGEARYRARWRELSGDEEAAAVAELRELAGGRADLLAEVAGIFEGTSEGEPDEPLARQAAWLCRQAGADPEAIPVRVAEGRRRGPPRSGPRHRKECTAGEEYGAWSRRLATICDHETCRGGRLPGGRRPTRCGSPCGQPHLRHGWPLRSALADKRTSGQADKRTIGLGREEPDASIRDNAPESGPVAGTAPAGL
jgi:hypothetical protein